MVSASLKAEGPATRPSAVIVSEGRTATTDYFLIPYLRDLGYHISILDCRESPDAALLAESEQIIISRYATREWLAALERSGRKGSRIIYFMDDDLLDWRALRHLPWRYKWKIISRALMHRRRLLKLCDAMYVSTAYLAKKYAQLHPTVLRPIPPIQCPNDKPVLVCYHGTASHKREIEWLVPIIERVQDLADHIHFELFGQHHVAKYVRALPRVSILRPMNWTNYLSYTSVQKRHLALAPLLSSRFNAARGPTKFYDYARMGAIGLYSNRPPYRDFINNGVDGVLLENDPALWADTLIELACDSDRRDRMVAGIRSRIGSMSADGIPIHH